MSRTFSPQASPWLEILLAFRPLLSASHMLELKPRERCSGEQSKQDAALMLHSTEGPVRGCLCQFPRL